MLIAVREHSAAELQRRVNTGWGLASWSETASWKQTRAGFWREKCSLAVKVGGGFSAWAESEVGAAGGGVGDGEQPTEYC